MKNLRLTFALILSFFDQKPMHDRKPLHLFVWSFVLKLLENLLMLKAQKKSIVEGSFERIHIFVAI